MRCQVFKPRFSVVSTCAAALSCCWLFSCKSVLSVCCLFTCPAVSRRWSVVCPVVCVCRPASALRRDWVISRFNGGVPVAASVGLSVSYSRTVVVISSSLTCSVVVEVLSTSCRTSRDELAAVLSVLISRLSSVCCSVLLSDCRLSDVAFFVAEQLPRNRTLSRIRAH